MMISFPVLGSLLLILAFVMATVGIWKNIPWLKVAAFSLLLILAAFVLWLFLFIGSD